MTAMSSDKPVRDLPGAVLFACQMNAIRSPMASAIMRFLTNNRVYSASAGVYAEETDPFAIAVMEELGIDISGHEPVTIAELHDTSFDLVITLAPEAHHQVLELTRTQAFDVEYWPTIDPSLAQGSRDQKLDAYRACRDELFNRIKDKFGLGAGAAV
jgi:protein-tyrosine-phosphatase